MYLMSMAIAKFASELKLDYATAVGLAVLLKEMESDLDSMNDDIFWMSLGKKLRISREKLVDSYREMRVDKTRDKERDKKRKQRAKILESPQECPQEGENEEYINNIYKPNNTDREKNNDLQDNTSSSQKSLSPQTPPSKPTKRRPRTVKPEQFDRFWDVYPRKIGKRECQKAWASLNPSDELVDQIVEDVKVRIKVDWASREKCFIPYPVTYIRHAGWEDEHTPEAQKSTTRYESTFQRRGPQVKYFDD